MRSILLFLHLNEHSKLLLFQLLLINAAFLLSGEIYCDNRQIRKAGKENWVIDKKAVLDDTSFMNGSYGGYFYLLADVQENIMTESVYHHYVIKLINENGVQDMSDLSVDFDPAFQSLVFHEVNVYRDGIKSDELSRHEIKSIQRETDMERFLYDGSLTGFINLQDIREGDILEYSFTVHGYNPVFRGQYSRYYYFEFNDPLKENYIRILFPSEKHLYFAYPFGRIDPVVVHGNRLTEYVWDIKDIDAVFYDNNVPAWYEKHRRVEITSFVSWNEVAELCLEDFSLSEKDMKKLQQDIGDMFPFRDKDSLIISAIRFVQDKVRYLAFESGLDAYKPVAPNKVLAARYGDCKAKALLLCSILRLNGVEAYPVLVNSSKIKSDSIRLPSYRIFNHTVVQLIRNGDSFFVDPTISNQGGRIDDIYIPDYGYGLVVKENPDSLIRLVNHTSSETCVKNYFTINKINGPADLKIVTRHTGNYADETRSYFKSRSLDEISRDYLKFYSNNYPYIRTSAQVKFTDDRDSNLFIVEENYIIDSIWMPSEKNKKEIVLTFAAHVINGIINVPASPERTMPYAITFPMNFIEDVYVSLPEEWPVNPFRKEIIDSAFRFSSDVSYADCNIKLNYKYSTLADHIPAKNFRSYYSNHQEVQNNLSYSITYNTAAIGDFKISWYAIILFVIITISGVYFAFRIFRHYNLAFNGTRSREIGGWLILIGLGLVISFGRIFYTIFLDVQYFDKKLWETVLGSFSIEDVSVFMLLSFELLVNTLMLIYNGLLLILFFKKRNIFPRLMIICLTVSAVFITVDTLVAFSVYPDTFTAEDKSTSYMQIGRSIISSIIWITYLVYSKRVKETFTEVSTYSSSALKDSIHVTVRE